MKKFVSFLTLICMLTTCFPMTGLATEDTPLVVSTAPADGEINVSIDTDLVLEFDGFVDADKFNRDKVIINGSHDMVDAFVYNDLNPTVMTIDLKKLAYGTRYVVELRNVSLDEGANTVNTQLAFTTEMPANAKIQPLLDIDCTTERKFASWNTGNAGNLAVDTEEGANKTNSSWAALLTDITDLQNVGSIRVLMKSTNGSTRSGQASFTSTADVTCQDGFSKVASDVNFTASGTEYQWIELPVNPTSADVTVARLWIAEGFFVKQVQVMPKTQSKPIFTKEPIMSVDATQAACFTWWRHDQKWSVLKDGANYLSKAGEWWYLRNQVSNYKDVAKVRITAKSEQEGAAKLSIIFSTQTTAWATASTAIYIQRNKEYTQVGSDYTVFEYDITHKDTDPDNATLWVNNSNIAGTYIKKIELLSAGYTEDEYVWGSYDLIKNYGEDDEEVMTKGGIEAGDYSAVLSGLYNLSGEDKTLVLANALYDGGKLVDVKVDSEFVADGEATSRPLVATLTDVPDYREGLEIKTFLWDDTQEPLKESIVIGKDERVRVLVAGNSITYHQPAKIVYGDQTIDWTGAWGMAASSEANDYAHLLISKADAAGYNTEFKIGNVKGLESDPSLALETYKEHQDFDPDVLVIALGANVGTAAVEEFVPKYKDLIDYIGADQVIIVTTICGGNAWNEIRAMAEENGYALADCLATYDANKSDANYTWGYMAQGTFGQNSVAWHPGNGGMKIMADQIWADALNDAILEAAATK